MGRTKRSAEDWRKAVYRNRIVPSAKVTLLYLGDHMQADRKVSRPRHLIARALGISERMVDKAIRAGHDAGLLTTVVPGRKGTTAVYQGLFPDVQREHCVRAKNPVQREPNVRAESAQKVRAETPFSANTVFAPVVSTGEPKPPKTHGCETCGDAGCSECVA